MPTQHLPHSPQDPLSSYVAQLGGKRTLRKILVANNGIAAVKAIRSIRRWSYEAFGDEKAIQFVSMATPEDVAANAEYVRMADMWTSVPGGSNNRNFANVDLICDIADRFSCDAVWAGWGHASENPALPAKLSELGITFLGPNAKSMHALGDKIASTIIAQSANVPTVAWSGTGLRVDYKAEGALPPHMYQKACVSSPEHAKKIAIKCGYPLVVKASEGGGGKGIRVVLEESAIQTAYRQVASEVPGSPIFLMRLVKNARHLEVQIVADEHGDAIALYGRDCSVQRRHQKIIEEGPVVAAPPHVWKGLELAAVALAKEVGYVGAGTVEYLYKGNKTEGEFYFLELNPRLQVEHPVTEWITGVNLPALQLHIGMGIPLRSISSIRKFLGLSEVGPAPSPLPIIASSSMVKPTPTENGAPLDEADDLQPSPLPPHGHVIACRVTAENPDEGFQPTSGAIQELTFRNTPNVWGYFSVGASGGVHEFADSQFGHLFAWGETRESSRRSLVLALKELSIRGDIRTTVEYLIKLLEMEAFKENRITTSWLDTLIADKVAAEKPPRDLAVIAGAVCRAHTSFADKMESFTRSLERGQIPALDSSLVQFPVELIYEDVKYCFSVTRSDLSAFRVRLSGPPGEGKSVLSEWRTLADGAKLVVLDGRSHVCYAREEPAGLRLLIDGQTCLYPKEYDPTTLASSVSGKLVRFLVQDGEHIAMGQQYVELEVMKMYLSLSAPEAGHINLVGTEGSSIDVGDIIATLELDDPSKIRRAAVFEGVLPDFDEPQAVGVKPHQRFAAAMREMQLLLRGFDARRSALDDFLDLIDDPLVCSGEIREVLSSLSGRIPSEVAKEIESQLQAMLEVLGIVEMDVDRKTLWAKLRHTQNGSFVWNHDWKQSGGAVRNAVTNIIRITAPIQEASELCAVASKYSNGSVFAATVTNLLDEYLNVETQFATRSGNAADTLFDLREKSEDISAVAEIAASHVRLKEKNEFLLHFLDILTRPTLAPALADESAQANEFKTRLHQLSRLYAPEYSDIALKARMVLADLRRPQFHQRRSVIGRRLHEIATSRDGEQAEDIQRMVGLSESILDVLVSFVLPVESNHVTSACRIAAAKVQLLRSYRAYEVCNMDVAPVDTPDSPLTATWRFKFVKKGGGAADRLSLADLNRNRSAPRGMTSFDSADDLSHVQMGCTSKGEEGYFRHGILAAFKNWSSMEKEFDGILDAYAGSVNQAPVREVNVMTVMLRWDSTAPRASGEAPLYSSRSSEDRDMSSESLPVEADVSTCLSDFCCRKTSRRALAAKAGIKTLTFIVAPDPANESVTYPGFYTFRVRNGFREDPIFRHIDPPMAFQLELSRLSKFSITRFGYPTRTVHVFFAQDKLAGQQTEGNQGKASARPPPTGIRSKIDRDDGKSQPGGMKVADSATSSEGRVKPGGTRIQKKTGSRSDKDVDARYFVRAVIRQAAVVSATGDDAVVSMPEAERAFAEALDAIEMASCNRRFRRTDFNHVFLNVIPPVQIEMEDVEAICRRMFHRYSSRCWSLRVFSVEIKVPALATEEGRPPSVIPLRFLLVNPTGHDLRVESYVESADPKSGQEKILSVSPNNVGSRHGSLLSEPYPVLDRIQRRRVVAQAMETTYVYDFLHIFTKELQRIWRRYSEDRLLGGFHRYKMPPSIMDSVELILSSNENDGESCLKKVQRNPGLSDIGMVAWLCVIRTPEYPNGREVVLIANDITFRSGSFGPEEDLLFTEASKLAREKGIPRIYLAANSGARIGVAEEVRDILKVAWIDADSPQKGFSFLGIDSEDQARLSASVKTKERSHGNLREITDVIGLEHGLGVENLMGSGMIASETSRAYDETFTLTYVTSRSVGIGAYLVRLGQRVIQKEVGAPIILTGHSALNKVLGHKVYISNEQLGGTKVMYPNGVSHIIVRDDVAGVLAILDWLSYVPKARGEALPVLESRDPASRPVTAQPPADGQPYDPRTSLIGGGYSNEGDDGRFLYGLFDKDSWREYLGGWAKTVIVGRGRLGGVPTGIIAVETRSVDCITPADPASPDTREIVVTQAGQVWYPDSAAKTAQAIRDFQREELPLFILANWRGFSGGMRDMFDEILKSGSLIVDALREYTQPVFVYIPPGGELRGGAWVVLDTLINPDCIEMYAAGSSRGGVLEPEGTVDVKYRRRNIIKTMHRLDETLVQLDKDLAGGEHSGGVVSDEKKIGIHEAIHAREAEILPVYRNIATSFCDLHDTPGRLLAKGAIRRIVNWTEARSFFYWRLRRRIAEQRVRRRCRKADPGLTTTRITGYLKKWAADYRMESGVNGHTGHTAGQRDAGSGSDDGEHWSFDKDDQWVFQWLEVEEDSIDKKIERIRVASVSRRVADSAIESLEGFVEGIQAAIRNCKNEVEKAKLVAAIQEKASLASSRSFSTLSSLGILSRLGKLGWDRDGSKGDI